MNPNDWLDSTYLYHLTIKHILSLKVGESVAIFLMDRNVLDLCCESSINPYGEKKKPTEFFKNNYYINFTKTEGIRGDWKWIWNNKVQHTDKNQEFHIDLGSCIFPLKDDKVPMEDNQRCFNLSEHAGKHYTKFPLYTKLGWRGNMMRVRDMNKLSKV